MDIQKVTKYVTSDNREFTDAEVAKAHQIVLDAEEELLSGPLAVAAKTGRADSVLRSMVSNAVQVRDILNKYIRRQPRKTNKPETVNAKWTLPAKP